ncbi:MAG: D-arabinose 5-phosphate isomerase [Deltaproteobacteria bacterium RIFCSPLOWO2_12_FULL_43_16]|nr:MAG: D-arabinose 5-phosphate isomerase [Deltaproteobacteria bacterium GWA2_43_19]OGQ09358.1 MAG: D-arabinose 5-phosphate isomerase [Deltaproteobacteria bacterium RIFCSPHIGHO2_02_FULL_43_33]OGQ58587.1 MAG: D-arabinose 5-phosphate isomerase [Deltaproteobacteria bacterium RIFCSPLOWO2_12_FULL_43_16]HBR16800.1 D-arabinose 5-phosphate isomerase [Deltaproteobacteria bacterium]
MKSDKTILTAKRVLKIEAEAITHLAARLDGNFSKAIDLILNATGKVIITGMGKSGLICQKIAATFASTGTPAFFLHPAEGVHGDLGMLMKDDIVIAVSNSGETEELIRIIPLIKRMGVKLIAMTGDKKSTLAKAGDVVLNVGVKKEACPLGLAPTASTTVTLAMGDAMAVALLEKKGFKEKDFALLHPGGSLGKRLLKVDELMHTGKGIPVVHIHASMKEAIIEITAKRLGVTGVVDGNGCLVGAVTDGDLRRALEKGNDILNKRLKDVMTKNPKKIAKGAFAESALKLMEDYSITSLFVYEGKNENKIAGVIHLHDLLKAGVV